MAATGTSDASAACTAPRWRRSIDAVERFFPDATRLTRPQGGHVLWVQLPDGVDAMDLYDNALGHGIRIAPGPMFSASGGYRDFIRLNTGFPWNETTQGQIETLGRLVADACRP